VGLRLRGVEVLTAQEDGTSRLADPDLLNRATELGRVLFSQDEDLLREATLRQRQGTSFAGAVCATGSRAQKTTHGDRDGSPIRAGYGTPPKPAQWVSIVSYLFRVSMSALAFATALVPGFLAMKSLRSFRAFVFWPSTVLRSLSSTVSFRRPSPAFSSFLKFSEPWTSFFFASTLDATSEPLKDKSRRDRCSLAARASPSLR
jgi:hypothetical protein